MAAKTEEKPRVAPKMGAVVDRGLLEDGRPYDDVFLGEGKTYRMTRITLVEADEAWDGSQNQDGTVNLRLNNRMQLVSSIVSPKTTLDDLATLTAIEVDALFRGYSRLNVLPPADPEGNA